MTNKLSTIYLWRDIFSEALEKIVEQSPRKITDGIAYISISENYSKLIEQLRKNIRKRDQKFNTLQNFIISTCCPAENILIDTLDAKVPVINNNCYIFNNNAITLNYALVNSCAKELFDIYSNDIAEVKKDFNVSNITFISLSGHCADLLVHCMCHVILLPQMTDLRFEKYPMLVDCNTYYKYNVTSHSFPEENINILNRLIKH
jgi:hypothetical protein